MKKIPLTQGKFAIVDNEDYETLSKHKWYYRSEGYAARNQAKMEGGRTILMHREILDTPKGTLTDHRSLDRLDNRRANLRPCTFAQNQHNRVKYKTNKSGYKGVSWHKGKRKWQVYIRINNNAVHLGQFFCLIKAAKAYDDAAIKYHGDFANLNFMENTHDAI